MVQSRTRMLNFFLAVLVRLADWEEPCSCPLPEGGLDPPSLCIADLSQDDVLSALTIIDTLSTCSGRLDALSTCSYRLDALSTCSGRLDALSTSSGRLEAVVISSLKVRLVSCSLKYNRFLSPRTYDFNHSCISPVYPIYILNVVSRRSVTYSYKDVQRK